MIIKDIKNNFIFVLNSKKGKGYVPVMNKLFDDTHKIIDSRVNGLNNYSQKQEK